MNENFVDYINRNKTNTAITRAKTFVRSDTKAFEPLFDEIRANPDCAYVTSINDMVSSGHTLDYISVAYMDDSSQVSYTDSGIGQLRGVCASRMLNFFGCPTVYNTMLDIDGKETLCEVDYARGDRKHFTVDSVVGIYGERLLEDNIPIIERMFDQMQKQGAAKNAENKTEFIKEYIYSYLVRKYALADVAYSLGDMGCIYNPAEDTVSIAPNTNFYRTFVMTTDEKKTQKRNQWYTKDMQYVQKAYPDVYERFMGKLQEFTSAKNGKPVYAQIIEKEVADPTKAQSFIGQYQAHIEGLSNVDIMSNN